MAFSNLATPGTGAEEVAMGADLEVIQTEGLGFLSIAGEAKVQLTSAWPQPPASTASLVSIAPQKGLVAAAGPDALYIATTESVRTAFKADKHGDSEIRPFEPQAKMPLPMRISQLAFTADEQYLLISAEQGGGLAIYEVQSLLQGTAKSAFELATSGESLRALAPNPMPGMAHLCALVTDMGNLLMANLADRNLAHGPSGPIIRKQVSCACWSTKGKQLVAGMADGTVIQMTRDGQETANIPKPGHLEGFHVSSISWLENNLFLVIHTETNKQPPASVYHVITRHAVEGKAPSFEFRKLTDPVEPFGSEKTPHHTVLRLRDYPPNIQDLLVVTSTSTECVGLLTRTKVPLASDKPAEAITNVFTTTEFTDDSRRAQLPMNADYAETYPIGLSLDLSSKDKVYRPIPSDEEVEQSPGPLPGLWALNNEGVLSAWWIVYNDAVREGKTYPGMIALGPSSQAPAPALQAPALQAPALITPSTSQPPAGSAFGAVPALGAKSSPWGAPATSASPANSTSSPFRSTAAQNPFAGAAAASQPTFGSSGFGGQPAPAFGQASALGGFGAKAPSPWSTGSTGTAAPAFGSHGFSSPGASGGKVFGSSAATPAPGGGFAGFASKGGFGSLGANAKSENIFAQPSPGPNPFTSKNHGESIFGKPTTSSGLFGSPAPSFPNKPNTAFPSLGTKTEKSSPFGSAQFVLGSTFKPDPATANDNEKPGEKPDGSLFGSGFGLSLGDATKSSNESSKDEDMEVATPTTEKPKPKSIFSLPQPTMPTTAPATSKFFSSSTQVANPFAGAAAAKATPAVNPFSARPAPSPPGSMFGSAKPSPFRSRDESGKPKTEGSPGQENPDETPLPPESTNTKKAPTQAVDDDVTKTDAKSKEAVPPPLPEGTSSNPEEEPEESPNTTEAPLPPDFLSKSEPKSPSPAPEAAPLPNPFEQSMESPPELPSSSEGDELSEEDADGEGESHAEASENGTEGSGVDVTKDLSPSSTGVGHTPGFTPQSSFGGMGGSTFSLMSRPGVAQPRKSLFGEVGRNAPVLPQPVPPSPRSPSPVRSAVPSRLHAEGSRSVSAPGMASHILGSSRQGPAQAPRNPFATRLAPQEDPNVTLQKKEKQKEKESEESEEPQFLEDDTFEIIQEHLDTETEPTLEMGDFTAMAASTADAKTSTVASQVEALYRDINNMLQTLALNARALSCFIQGHTELAKEDGRTKDDLGKADDWVLCEAEDLGQILDEELTADLEEGRLKDVDDTWDSCQDLLRELPRLRAKHEDLKRTFGTVLDPEQAVAARSLPLSAEQAAQQNELRHAYARMMGLLSEAEGGLTVLKTKLASAASAAGKATSVPTVEAVMRTIMKMTSMAEKRSGDIDVLENQMRKLRFGSVGFVRDGTPGAMDGSPLKTPSPRKSVFGNSSMSSETMRKSFGSSVGASGGWAGTPQRKKISGFTDEEKQAIRAKMQRRAAVLGQLKESLKEVAPKVQRLADE